MVSLFGELVFLAFEVKNIGRDRKCTTPPLEGDINNNSKGS